MTCACVQRHVPLPVKTFSVTVGGEVIEVCPTTFHNMLELVVEYKKYEGPPPGSIQKHYSAYVRELSFALFKESTV